LGGGSSVRGAVGGGGIYAGGGAAAICSGGGDAVCCVHEVRPMSEIPARMHTTMGAFITIIILSFTKPIVRVWPRPSHAVVEKCLSTFASATLI